jgi:hypothetical protein
MYPHLLGREPHSHYDSDWCKHHYIAKQLSEFMAIINNTVECGGVHVAEDTVHRRLSDVLG